MGATGCRGVRGPPGVSTARSGSGRSERTGNDRTLATSSGVAGASVPSGGANGSLGGRLHPRSRALASTVQLCGVTRGRGSPFCEGTFTA